MSGPLPSPAAVAVSAAFRSLRADTRLLPSCLPAGPCPGIPAPSDVERELLQSGTLPIAVDPDFEHFIASRRVLLDERLAAIDAKARGGLLPDVTFERSVLKIAPIEKSTPPEAETLVARLYAMLPRIRITHLLSEVARWTMFTDCFTHLRSGETVADPRVLMASLLADGLNLGLTRMAEACTIASLGRRTMMGAALQGCAAASWRSGEMVTRADVVVLGAGMVGVSVALHLQRRGRDVVLVDRRGAGEETSYGNAGLIQREAVFPYAFPREFGTILSYAMNHRSDAVYHLSALPRLAPWLFRYWQNATPERIERSARALAPLMARCVEEHDALSAQAGGAARALVQQKGWIRCLSTEESLRQRIGEAQRLDEFGVDYAVLTGAQLRELEPHVSEKIIGAIHFRGSPTSSDPGMLTKAYADLFVSKGGRFLKGDARRLAQDTPRWSIPAENEPITAREAVVALGPWSDDVFRPLGYDIPLAVKRGYHMHYGVQGNATLGHPLHDGDGGYALVPMSKGIRLTTGVEFAERDAPPTPVQLARDEPLARELFPLGERLEPAPWMGRRPCLPDMVPVIGRGERHHGLWFAFGHAHHGFTLGPVTGRLLAEMMTGETPFTDPSPYSAIRFRN